MVDNRCPMCGKHNAEDLESCQFCGARLSPLISPSGHDEIGSDLPEWSDQDWIDDPETDGDDSFEDLDDPLDWLKRIQSEGPPEDISPPPTDAESSPIEEPSTPEEKDDWLQHIRDLHQSEQQADDDSQLENGTTNEAGKKPIFDDDDWDADKDDIPDWLDRFHEERVSEDTREPEASKSGADELPDWLFNVKSTEPADAAPESEPQDALPSWLNAGLDPQKEPDSLSSESSIGADEGEGELPDWLSETTQDEPEGAPTFPPPSEDSPDKVPDLGVGGESAATEETAPEMDWLPEPPEDEPVPVFQDSPDDIPDWLSGAETDDLAVDEMILPTGAEEVDWLSEPGDEVLDAATISLRPGDYPPDWLSDASEAEKTDKDDEVGRVLQPDEIAQDGIEGRSPSEDEDLQDWFSELDEGADVSSQPEPEVVVSSSDEDMPGWLKNLGSVVTGTIEENDIPEVDYSTISPFVDQDQFDDDLLDMESLPEWLSPESESKEAGEPVEGSDLTPAELPGWLAAMRPAREDRREADIDSGAVESSGPLSGLRSVLPAEPEITRFKKPPVYSAKLQVTNSQLAHADIFKKLLSDEVESEPIPEPPLVSSQRILRWLIALILTAIIGFVVVDGSQLVPLPKAIPDATLASSRIINAIPDQAPILLAFDYEPGLAGEMHAAAAAVVDHLMLKGARLTLVSTLPTGPAVAEYFIQSVQKQHGYTSGLQYINLGYIPGGAAGLLSFVRTPQWVLPLSYEGMDPWKTRPLQGVNALSDFALLVVITDNSDTARSWVEQVEPRIGDTPMLAVVSAQAEPMVRPYFGTAQTSQIQGIVSGITGGAAYEVAMGRTNLGRIYWDAFSASLVIAVGVILVGGAFNLIQLLLARNNGNKRSAK